MVSEGCLSISASSYICTSLILILFNYQFKTAQANYLTSTALPFLVINSPL